MEPPSKRCKVCHQTFPILPHLPVEIIDKILSYLPFKLHVQVLGVNATTRRLALQRPDRFVYYFKHNPIVDEAFAKRWKINTDDPARPYLGELCRFECPQAAQQFFNERVPSDVALRMLKTPCPPSDFVLSHRWCWWRLARALIEHETKYGRELRLTRVCVDTKDSWIDYDVDINDLHSENVFSQPIIIITVTLSDQEIKLYMYYSSSRLYRIL
ncbi:late expression factor 7 [Choristoneura diversana nucleopolyhedrovirus]|nr:late expression factor 7 [Choristoneura diversana nucleopolyhedrovirus]